MISKMSGIPAVLRDGIARERRRTGHISVLIERSTEGVINRPVGIARIIVGLGGIE